MERAEVVVKRQPVFAIIAAAILVVALFMPMLLVTLPVMTTIGLAIASAFRKEQPRPLAYIVGGLAVLLLIGSNARNPMNVHEQQDVKASSIYADAKWDYGQSKDQMRGTVTKNATLYSPTDLDLPAPYDGTDSASIYVTDTSGFMLAVEKGQFQCGSNDSVAIKVDSGPVWNYPCSTSDNGQTNYLFINSSYDAGNGQPSDPKDLLSKGRKMIIEAPFFDAGSRQISFNIAGFNAARLK